MASNVPQWIFRRRKCNEWTGLSVLKRPHLQHVREAAQFDGLPIQAAQQALDHGSVLHLALEADEVHCALGNPQHWELLRGHHGLDSLHHLPVGDALARELKLRQSHADGHPGDGFEVDVVLGGEAHCLRGVMDDGGHRCRPAYELRHGWENRQVLLAPVCFYSGIHATDFGSLATPFLLPHLARLTLHSYKTKIKE